MSKTPIGEKTLAPLVGMPDGSMIQGTPQIVNYTKEVLRNPLDTSDSTSQSAISLLPPEERFIIETHTKRNPDVFKMSERNLLNHMSAMGFDPSSTENLLRNRFWLEYDHAVTGGFPSIRINEVIRGVCSFKFFRETFLANQFMVAYLMLPPINFKVKQEETLLFALDKLRQVLDLPSRKPNGDVDMSVVKAQMGIYHILERRVQGEVIQKTMNAHVIAPLHPATQAEQEQLSEEQIIMKMQELVDKKKARDTTRAAMSDVFTVKGTPIVTD